MWNLGEWYGWIYLQDRIRDADREQTCRQGAGEGRVGRPGRLGLMYLRRHVSHRQQVGTCCITQGAQLRAARWFSWVRRRVGGPARRERRCVCVQSLQSPVRLPATPWTVGLQAPLSVGFSRKNTAWVAVPPSRPLPDPGVRVVSPASLRWQVGPVPLVAPGKPRGCICL